MSLARIPIQQVFCDACSGCIKTELQKISGISNVRLYPLESLVCFNFLTANTLSTALNSLWDIGYTEKGDTSRYKRFSKLSCSCKRILKGSNLVSLDRVP